VVGNYAIRNDREVDVKTADVGVRLGAHRFVVT
jgi:hypothetical protein